MMKMSKNKYHWIVWTETGAIAEKIRQNAETIEAFRLPPSYYIWAIGSFGEDDLRYKIVSNGETPKPEDFNDLDFLIHIDNIDLRGGTKGVKASALKLAARAIFPFKLSAKADDDEEDWEYEEK